MLAQTDQQVLRFSNTTLFRVRYGAGRGTGAGNARKTRPGGPVTNANPIFIPPKHKNIKISHSHPTTRLITPHHSPTDVVPNVGNVRAWRPEPAYAPVGHLSLESSLPALPVFSLAFLSLGEAILNTLTV